MRVPVLSSPINIDRSFAREKQVKDAAEKFEAMMLGEILKPLQNGLNGDEESEKSSNPLQSYGTEALAQSIVHFGGVGIAKNIEKQFSSDENGRKIALKR